jgi:hypothetical protein
MTLSLVLGFAAVAAWLGCFVMFGREPRQQEFEVTAIYRAGKRIA